MVGQEPHTTNNKRKIKMSILTENIKLYNPLGNRYILGLTISLYMVFLTTCLLGIWSQYNVKISQTMATTALFFFLGSMVVLGTSIARVQLEILTKPFSYCIPDQHKGLNKVIFIIGIPFDLIYCVLFLFIFKPTGLMGVIYFITVFSIGFFVFLITLWLTFILKNEHKKYIRYLFIIAMLYIMTQNNRKVSTFSFFDILLYNPLPVVFLTTFLSFSLYQFFDNHNLKKKYLSGKKTISFEPIDPRSREQANEALSINRLSEKVQKGNMIDKLFSGKIHKLNYLSKTRSIISKLYCQVDRYITLHEKYMGIWLLAGFIFPSLALLLLGYDMRKFFDGSFEYLVGFFIICLPCYFITSILAPVFNNHLLPQGRAEQFINNVTILMIQLLVSILWFLLIILLSKIIGSNMPVLAISGISMPYKTLEISFIFWPMVIIPLFDIFKYNSKSPDIAYIIFIMAFILGILGIVIIIGSSIYKPVALIFIFICILFANGVFINMLRHRCFKKDLDLFI
jgi:hypothetical protein